MNETPLVTHRGGCHCGRIRFEVQAPAHLLVLDCNCSMCRMTAFQHLIVPASRFRLLQGQEFISEYRFNTGVARHLFCKVCGVKSFYVPRSHPNGYSVNLRCLDAGTIESVEVQQFDDTQREVATAAVEHLGHDGGSAA